MKRIKEIGIVVGAVLVISGITVYAVSDAASPIQTAARIGSAINSMVTAVIKGDKGAETPGELDSSRIVGTVLGEKIKASDIEIKAKLFQIGGTKDPLGAAWDAVKVQTYERQFAKEHDLLPTEQEIVDFTQNMRKVVESSEDGKEYAKALIEAAGMTEDEYWNDYKPKHESPAHLIAINVEQYFSDHNMPMVTADSIDGQLTDQTLIDEFK